MYIYFRNEKKLKALEKKLKISTRKNHDSCLSDLKSAKVKKHKTLLAKLRKEVCDRAYLLELIKKYASKYDLTVKTVDRCTIFTFSVPASVCLL